MKTEDIARSLTEIFEAESRRIIFWHDPEAEFADSVAELDLPDVTVIRLNKTGFLALKIRLEIEEPEKCFLLYAPFPEPAVTEDWLLDLRSFSRTFRADRASLLLNELELSHQSLRMHLNKRKA
ncbi:MAG: BREX-1 system phosphatase PglZ type A, partial [Erysipelotrichia bacterium]|nr:BREX-1 system phosphatase PglZ type A [Erysipelotrichia bacterium]